MLLSLNDYIRSSELQSRRFNEDDQDMHVMRDLAVYRADITIRCMVTSLVFYKGVTVILNTLNYVAGQTNSDLSVHFPHK